MVVIGGLGTLSGPIVAAFLVYVASEFLRDFGGYQLIVFALLVIIFGRFFRDGLWGMVRKLQSRASGGPPPRRRRRSSRCRSSPSITSAKSFGGIRALTGATFSIDPGELVGLIGPNGSGKTTLINILSGHLTADAGRVTLDGRPIAGMRPEALARRGIQRTFQITRAFPRMSVLDNLLVAGCALGLAQDAAEQRARALIHELSLTRVIDLDAGHLSGGQLKLLEFGSCFMVPPRIALLDEPFASVHPTMKEIMAGFIRRRHGRADLPRGQPRYAGDRRAVPAHGVHERGRRHR